MNKFVVITSIFKPTKAILQIAQLEDWKMIVVGDKKTPEDWKCENIKFISIEEQKLLNYKITETLPYNHYARKMVGYLYAMNFGADIICDLDDDNYPLSNWGIIPDQQNYRTIVGKGFVNIYKYYSKNFIWPRGYPLQNINNEPFFSVEHIQSQIGIWQFLANGDPDVDAIYRLLFPQKEIIFEENGPLILDQNVFSPCNSQNTLFIKEVFPLLYLPAFVDFRLTDIMRGLIAQPILWNMNLRLGIQNATAFQDRNVHNYFSDFKNEINMYLHSEEIATIAQGSISKDESISNNLLQIYKNLKDANIVNEDEIKLLSYWLKDIESIQ